VVGEVRGPEVVAMMRALTNGASGKLCTIHARRPDIIFDRIAELYALAQENLSEQLAYRQTANGLDISRASLFSPIGLRTDPDLRGDLRHRPARRPHQLNRVSLVLARVPLRVLLPTWHCSLWNLMS
jgi:hypothetical protein